MLYAAIDIHKHVFQAAVLDPELGEVSRSGSPQIERVLRAGPSSGAAAWRRSRSRRRPAGLGLA
jgi:hypothetical protein